MPMEAKTASEAAPDFASRSPIIGRRDRPGQLDGAFSTRTGVVVAPRGRLVVALTLTFGEDRISGYTVIANPARLGRLSISVLDYPFAR